MLKTVVHNRKWVSGSILIFRTPPSEQDLPLSNSPGHGLKLLDNNIVNIVLKLTWPGSFASSLPRAASSAWNILGLLLIDAKNSCSQQKVSVRLHFDWWQTPERYSGPVVGTCAFLPIVEVAETRPHTEETIVQDELRTTQWVVHHD